MKVTLCTSCRLGRSGFADSLRTALDQAGLRVEVGGVDCMSGCTRPSTIAFRAAGKTAYLFGDLTEDDLPDLIAFARLYHAAPDGVLADARPLGALRLKAIARIPAQGSHFACAPPLATLTKAPDSPQMEGQGVPSGAKRRD